MGETRRSRLIPTTFRERIIGVSKTGGAYKSDGGAMESDAMETASDGASDVESLDDDGEDLTECFDRVFFYSQ